MVIRRALVLFIPMLALGACSDGPEDPFASLTTLSPTTTMSDGDGDGDGDDETTGDGDGDGDPTTGDGDGDPTAGDGDGDPTAGDGDGDPTTGDGDGDGDPTTGDGDGDMQTICGWYDDPIIPGYYCGGMGSDPNNRYPIDCPPGLVEGGPCGELTGVGCCDQNGANWYCADDGQGGTFAHEEDCR